MSHALIAPFQAAHRYDPHRIGLDGTWKSAPQNATQELLGQMLD